MNLMKKSGIAVIAALLLSLFGPPAHAADANRQAERQAFRTAITEYRTAMLARRNQVVAIRTAFRSAVATAKAGPVEGRKAAVQAAKATRDAALAALGVRPVKPIRPASLAPMGSNG